MLFRYLVAGGVAACFDLSFFYLFSSILDFDYLIVGAFTKLTLPLGTVGLSLPQEGTMARLVQFKRRPCKVDKIVYQSIRGVLPGLFIRCDHCPDYSSVQSRRF